MKKVKSENKLKAAIIGCGKMGICHLNVLKLNKRVIVTSIADPKESAKRIKGFIGQDVEIFNNANDLMQRAKPKVVHIVTPPDTHYELGKIALEGGAHVLIEKPFALKASDAEELIGISKSRGLQVYAGHQLLAHLATRKAERYLNDIGEIVHVESYFAFRKVRKSLSPVDQVIDILPHPVYTLLHFLKFKGDLSQSFEIITLDADAEGEVRAMVSLGKAKGLLTVTLKGRPVDSYLKLVGTNGTVLVDYVRGAVINLSGAGADAVAAVITPYRQAWQTVRKTTAALAGMAFKKNKSYEGLPELIADFYRTILDGKEPLITPCSIFETVRICEKIGLVLKEKEKEAEIRARKRLEETEQFLPAAKNDGVLVTGGTGFLGKEICRELRSAGLSVRSVSRKLPRFSDRLAGVKYEAFDLAEEIPAGALTGMEAVVHCAAETSGGMDDHERNSAEATRKIIEAAFSAGVKKLIHISSLAVLKPGANSECILNESSQVDKDNPARGAYVWGKAQAEDIIDKMRLRGEINVKIIRPGPLVDFRNFEAPGRLGREIAPYFIVMGGKNSRLSLCGVQTAAQVVRHYLENFDSVPDVLNLVEPEALTRQSLIKKLLENRKDLNPLFIPGFLVKSISGILFLLQKAVRPGRKPLSIAQAFSSENYRTDLAAEIILKANMNQSSASS
jgi:predicted dehydrogenase/nucleoside-diphosphate-sugar epimerase